MTWFLEVSNKLCPRNSKIQVQWATLYTGWQYFAVHKQLFRKEGGGPVFSEEGLNKSMIFLSALVAVKVRNTCFPK